MSEERMSGQDQLTDRRPRTILDIGANAGDFAMALATRNPGHRVIAVEPVTALAEGIEDRLRAEGVTNVEVARFAIDAAEGPAVINVAQTGDWGVSSLLTLHTTGIADDEYWQSRPDLAFTATEEIQRITLHSLMARYDVDEVDFVKLDVQGLDLVALESAGHALPRIRAGMLEVPTSLRNRLYADEDQDLGRAYATLVRLGFEVYNVKPNDPATNEVNVYFVRRGEDAGAVERELSLRGVHLYDGKHYWALACSTVEELRAAEGLPAAVAHARGQETRLTEELAQARAALGVEVRNRREAEGRAASATDELSLAKARESVLRRELARAQDDARQLSVLAETLGTEVTGLSTSTSWRVTRPLRRAADVARLGRRVARRVAGSRR